MGAILDKIWENVTQIKCVFRSQSRALVYCKTHFKVGHVNAALSGTAAELLEAAVLLLSFLFNLLNFRVHLRVLFPQSIG